MRSHAKYISLLLLPVLVMSAMALKGCGTDTPDATDLGCPSGTALATGSDIIQRISSNGTLKEVVTDADWAGTQFEVTPPTATDPGTYSLPFVKTISFYVTDQFASEKNDICVEVTAEGVFWDRTFTTILGINRWVTKTSAHGVVDVYYSTQAVLASAPAPTAGQTGTDATYADQIWVRSGSATPTDWNLDITILGCPDPAVDSTPCP